MAKKGKINNKEWNYELNPVFTIGILNFAFKDGDADADKLYHHVQLKDQDCQVFYDKLHFYLAISYQILKNKQRKSLKFFVATLGFFFYREPKTVHRSSSYFNLNSPRPAIYPLL